METLFIIGREPELSVAELEAAAGSWSATVSEIRPEGVILHHATPLPQRAIDRLGGSIKQISVLERFERPLAEILEQDCTVEWLAQQFPEGRIEFGVSLYGGSNKERASTQRHFLDLKKKLRAAGRVARFVTSSEPQLSAVVIHRNGLDKRGKEFVLFQSGHDVSLGVTVAVQDYQAYGIRDFGRPAADPKSGMLPPKVAQMMLNIARIQPQDVLYDPFCGSGTILQEALLLGVHEIHGSDSEGQAVKDSQENVRWLMKEYPRIQATVEITKHDARQMNLKPTVIVTEPYLGRPLRGRESRQLLLDQARELERLYRDTAAQWLKRLAPGGRVVMIWPEFLIDDERVAVDLTSDFAKLGFQAEPLLSEEACRNLKHGDRLMVDYGRDDARVRRQIRLWTKP